MKWSKEEVSAKLQDLLNECMESANQEGSLKIDSIQFEDDDRMEGTGTIKFVWCTPEPENEQPYFVGY